MDTVYIWFTVNLSLVGDLIVNAFVAKRTM